MVLADHADVAQTDDLVHCLTQVVRQGIQTALIHDGSHLAVAQRGQNGILGDLADVVGVAQRGPAIVRAVNGAQLQGLIDLGTGNVDGSGADGGIVVAPDAQSTDLFTGVVIDAVHIEVAQGVVVGLVCIPIVLNVQLTIGFLDDFQKPVVLHGVINLGRALPRKRNASAEIRLRQHAGVSGSEDHGAIESTLG